MVAAWWIGNVDDNDFYWAFSYSSLFLLHIFFHLFSCVSCFISLFHLTLPLLPRLKGLSGDSQAWAKEACRPPGGSQGAVVIDGDAGGGREGQRRRGASGVVGDRWRRSNTRTRSSRIYGVRVASHRTENRHPAVSILNVSEFQNLQLLYKER